MLLKSLFEGGPFLPGPFLPGPFLPGPAGLSQQQQQQRCVCIHQVAAQFCVNL